MTTWTTLANLAGGDQPLTILDGMFTNCGNLSVTPCTSSGINTILLTPLPGGTPPATYADNRLYLFRATGTTTGPATVNISSLGTVNLFKSTDANGNGVQATTGDVTTGGFYLITYSTILAGLLIIGGSTSGSGGGGGGGGIGGVVQANGLVVGTNANTVASITPMTAGQVPVGQSSSSAPVGTTLSGDIASITAGGLVTISAGAITLSKMAQANANSFIMNNTAGVATPTATPVSTVFAAQFGVAQQGILFNGTSAAVVASFPAGAAGPTVSRTSAGVYTVTLGTTALNIGYFTTGIGLGSGGNPNVQIEGPTGTMIAGSGYAFNVVNNAGTPQDSPRILLMFY